MQSGMDSKDGLRELIEMRNNKRNNNRGLMSNFISSPPDWPDNTDKQVQSENDSIRNNGASAVKEELSYNGDAQNLSIAGENLANNLDDPVSKTQGKQNSDSDNYEEEDEEDEEETNTIEQTHDDYYDNITYDDQLQETSDSNLVPPDNIPVPLTMDTDQDVYPNDQQKVTNKDADVDSEVWVLPAERNDCTLEEIRRGQVINKTASNECPVLGCGKKINEMRIEPSPGTIASGLRTHVLFVHYANRKVNKKRKLGWSSLKRRNQPSPKKQSIQKSNISPTNSKSDFDIESKFSAAPSLLSSMDLTHQSTTLSRPGQLNRPNIYDAIQTLVKPSAERASSIHNLMQITKNNKQKNHVDTTVQSKASLEKLNPTTSSLFSILAGLTQQQQANQPQPPISRNIKTAQGTNTINISQCSRNPINSSSNNNNSRTVNSSLMSLLNEKISNNVSSSLQAHIKKNVKSDCRNKISTSTPMQSVLSPASTSHYSNNNDSNNFNNGTSILNNLCSGNGDGYSALDNSMPLNSFIESIAIKTGANIGQAGIAEAKKILEKFTSSLVCSSQTIADHYLAPYGGDVPQQKPEISPSDIMLAYKMMHKSHGQP